MYPNVVTMPLGRQALHVAAGKGHLGVVEYLVLECGLFSTTLTARALPLSARVNVDASDHKGETALHMALAEKQAAVALFLMREGKASLEAKSVQGLTPLMHACVQGMLECVRFLVLGKAVDVGAKDSDGLDAAFHAAGAGHVDVLSFLVSEANVVDMEGEHGSKGYRLLHTAAKHGSLEVVTWLGFAPRGREWQLGDGDLVGEGGTCECPSTG